MNKWECQATDNVSMTSSRTPTTTTVLTCREQLCRLCAESKDNDENAAGFVGIYDEEGIKLGIETKIIKCLQIQIFANDCLPSYVCLDCCMHLNQFDEFFEKTNQAQCSLRQMLLDSTVQSNQEPFKSTFEVTLDSELHSQKKLEVYLKEEYEENNHKLKDSSNYHDRTIGSEEKLESEESVRAKVDSWETSDKEESNHEFDNNRVKKKGSFHKADVFDCQDFETEKGDKPNCERNVRLSVKIPDNYMTGTDSDMEMIVQSGKELKNSDASQALVGARKGEKLDRYPWLCTDCNDKLPSLEALENHHRTIHNQKAKYMCVQCCKVYEKYYGFLTHVKRHKTKAKFSCDDCGKTFVHNKVLETHKAIHSEERPHVCQTCGKTFRQQSALYIHSRCHLPDNMKNKYPCDQCNKRFSTKPNLVTHMRIHSGVRNFTCDQCGKSFIQKGNLEAHFLTHTAEKPHKCCQCSKAFKTTLQLKKHETIHTGDKPHKCGVCGKTFREKGTLREHHRIHTGAMPFSCEFCGKLFRFKGILTTHRRQHTGERPYSCETCQHHFTNWPNYNKHMKRRHGINTSTTSKKIVEARQVEEDAGGDNDAVQREGERQESKSLNKSRLQTARQREVSSQRHRQSRTQAPRPIAPAPGPTVSSTTVQVIQTIPQVTIASHPIVLQGISCSSTVGAIRSFDDSDPLELNSSTPVNHQQPQHVNSSTFGVAMPLANFLHPHVPSYNFYNVSVNEADASQHR